MTIIQKASVTYSPEKSTNCWETDLSWTLWKKKSFTLRTALYSSSAF